MEGRSEVVTAIHLSVVNAPVFGGRMHLALPGSNIDDAGDNPGDFHLVAEGLRVVVPQSFEDVVDAPIGSTGS